MDRNAGEFAPKGEVPTEAEFARLLCDKTFVDYFNAFLSLPVFPQRLLYKFASQNLELDPPLQRTQYRSDRMKLMRWVRTHRAPFFFKSDLYLEYKLCKQLQKTQLHLTFLYDSERSSAKDKIMERQLMSRWLGRISGMRRFRRFLSRTAGQKSLQFWVDAEKMKCHGERDDEERLALLRYMEAKYLVKETMAIEIPGGRASIAAPEPSPEDSSAARGHSDASTLLERILIAQGFYLRSMQNYWVPRFLIHCKLRFQRRTGRSDLHVYRPNFYVVEVQSLSEMNAAPDDELEQSTRSSRSLAVKTIQLKRQRVSNLLSMFSSTTARHSEVSALRNLEDTGEMVTSGQDAESDAKDATGDYREWLADEFPLPDISEESLVTPSRDSSARAPAKPQPREDLTPLPIEFPPLTPSPEPPHRHPKLSILEIAARGSSRREVAQKEKSLMKIRSLLSTLSVDKAKLPEEIQQQGLTISKSDESLRSKHSVQTIVEADITGDQPSLQGEPSHVGGETESFRGVISEKSGPVDEVAEEAAVPRLPSVTAHRRLSTGTPSSLTMSRGSLTSSNQSIQTPSRRRMSVHGTSSGKIGSSSRMTTSGAPKKVYKPQRRSRAMSISFRLADFSFMLDKEEGETKKDVEAEDGSLTLPQLDIQALQDARTKAVEKKKLEEKQKRAEKIKKMKKRKKGGMTEEKKTREKRAKDKKQKELDAKRAQLGKSRHEHHVSKLTRGNLEKFDLQTSYITESPMRRLSLRSGRQPRPRQAPTCKSTDSRKNASSHSSSLYDKYRSDADQESLKLPSIYSTTTGAMTLVELDDEYGHESISQDQVVNSHLQGAVLSDHIAGRPWETFMKKQGNVAELHYLQFWQTTQELITLLDVSQEEEGPAVVRRLMTQRMTSLFLVPSGERFVDLGQYLSTDLVHHLNDGSNVFDLLQHAQRIALEALSDSWTTYQKHDNDEFLMRTAYRKNFARSTLHRGSALGAADSGLEKDSQLSLDTSNHMLNMLKTARGKPETESGDRLTVAPHRMWKALELAEGISNLYNDEGDLSDPSDPEVDSDDEGSLRRPKMVVYKERKVEKPLAVAPKKEKEMPMVASKGKREKIRSLPSVTESPDVGTRPESKGVCTAIRKGGKTIYRPPRPKVFQDVLRDQGHIEFFRRFLIRENAELPLQFWNAVEQMKTSGRDAKARQNKTILIVRKFFGKSTDYGAALDCDAEVIQDIPTMEKVTPQMILSAQACVARSMGEKWFESYRGTFPEDSVDGDEVEATNKHKLEPRQRTRALWSMFFNNVTNFRRGMMSLASLNAFKDFLGKEIRREIEKQNQTGVQSKRMISNKTVMVEKLLNDLSFWVEVEKFKELADNAARAAAAGTYTLEDEDYVQQKAGSIIDCFLDSKVPPKVQINIPQEMADEILDCAESGLIERGLFHDAALYIFSVLLYCWKRFCRERFIAQDSEFDMSSPTDKGKVKKRKKKKPSTPTVCGVKIKTITGTSVDEPPRFHFTLQHGLQLILPPKPKHEDVQQEQLRQILRQLYPNADGQNLEYYVRQTFTENSAAVLSQLPPPSQHAVRRMSKALPPGGIAANLLSRRMTRQFSVPKDLLDT